MTRSIIQSYNDRRASFIAAGSISLLLILNILACWIGYLVLGGSAFFSEAYEGVPCVRPLHGDEVHVSAAASWYSLLHAASVFLTLPVLAFTALGTLYEWVRLQMLARKLRSA